MTTVITGIHLIKLYICWSNCYLININQIIVYDLCQILLFICKIQILLGNIVVTYVQIFNLIPEFYW